MEVTRPQESSAWGRLNWRTYTVGPETKNAHEGDVAATVVEKRIRYNNIISVSQQSGALTVIDQNLASVITLGTKVKIFCPHQNPYIPKRI